MEKLLRATWRLAVAATVLYVGYRALDATLSVLAAGAEKGQRAATRAQQAVDSADEKLAEVERAL